MDAARKQMPLSSLQILSASAIPEEIGRWLLDVPGSQKGPGPQFSLRSAVDPPGVPSGRRHIPQDLCLLLLWDAGLKEADAISGGTGRRTRSHFRPLSLAGPSFLGTRSMHTFTPARYLGLGLARGGPACLQVWQGWGRWSEAWEVGASWGSACGEGCSCPGAFVWEAEVPELPCGSESVY